MEGKIRELSSNVLGGGVKFPREDTPRFSKEPSSKGDTGHEAWHDPSGVRGAATTPFDPSAKDCSCG